MGLNLNRYRLICQYCDNNWEANYVPNQKVFCSKCGDSHIRVIDIGHERVDYYIGCPPFPEKSTEKEDIDKWYLS